MQEGISILVVRLSSLGDVLMTFPAVCSIKRMFPHSHITWLVEGSVSDFLSYQKEIDKIVKFPRSEITNALKRGKISTLVEIIKDFMKELRAMDYDVILDFHGTLKSVILSMLSGGKKIVGFSKVYAKEGSYFFYDVKVDGKDKRIHKVERNMLLSNYLGVKKDVPNIKLEVPPYYHEYIDVFFKTNAINGDVFAINPFSSHGSEFKRWDMYKYAQLIKKIGKELNVKIIILWGPKEYEEAYKLKDMSGKNAYLACPTDIPQLFALLKRVKIYISGDTGVMHLAAFAETPVVAIFGPTDHKVNAPYGKNCIIVKKDVQCSPCKKRDCKERLCLESIEVDEVFHAIKDMYSRIQ